MRPDGRLTSVASSNGASGSGGQTYVRHHPGWLGFDVRGDRPAVAVVVGSVLPLRPLSELGLHDPVDRRQPVDGTHHAMVYAHSQDEALRSVVDILNRVQ